MSDAATGLRTRAERRRETPRRAGLQAGPDACLERVLRTSRSRSRSSRSSRAASRSTTRAWNNGGPIAISWGWPIVCGLVLFVAWSMSELVSAYPTAGGIYWWASELGGKAWGWFTGWFNLSASSASAPRSIYGVGAVPVRAPPRLRARPRLRELRRHQARACRDLRAVRADPGAPLADQHLLVAPRRALQRHLRRLARDRRRRDHRDPDPRADHHQSASFVFGQRINNTGFTAAPPVAVSSGSTCCRSGSCSRCTRRPATTHRRTSRRRRRRVEGRCPRAVAVGLLRRRGRLARAAGDHVRRVKRPGRHQQGRRHRVRGVRRRAEPGLGEGSHPDHRHGRSAVLRPGVPHERVAHVLRVLARPGGAWTQAVDARSTTTACRPCR